MELNPPETEPRDGTMILAKLSCPLYQINALVPALFNFQQRWDYSESMEQLGDVYMDGGSAEDEELIGWLPMPKIDEEGNVTWPSASPA